MTLSPLSDALTDLRAAAESLKTSGRLAEAVDLYRSCLESAPDDLDLLYEHGEALLKLERLEDAADSFRRALSNYPKDAACTLMLAKVLRRQKKPLESLHYYRRAQRLAPHVAIVHLMVGLIAAEVDLRDESRAAFTRVLEVEPNNISAHFCLCMMNLTMFSTVAELEEGRYAYARNLYALGQITRLDSPAAIEAAFEATGMMSTFFLPYQGQNDCVLQKVYGEWMCRVMAARFPAVSYVTSRLNTAEKIRIGFVSAHFKEHSVWKIVTRGWMKYLDRSKFMLFCYYTGSDCDAVTTEARSYSDVFSQGTDIAAMADTILRHQPHVLIYPGMSMDPYTMKLASLRLAPIQCASWGHPETTGLPTMDYFLSSDLMEPVDADQHYSEKLVRLPNLSVCYEQLSPPVKLPTVIIPGVLPGDVKYLCCQNLMKYLPQYDDVFPEIALRVPNAKFVFIKFAESHYQYFLKRMNTAFDRQGLKASDFIVFVPPMDGAAYAAMNAVVDVFLDSIGWSGGNTTFESLPFDKPIVTLPGDFMRGRHAAAILRMMGVDETIATDKHDYVDIAVRLGNDSIWYNYITSLVAENKHRAYGDMTCVRALENFIESVCFK